MCLFAHSPFLPPLSATHLSCLPPPGCVSVSRGNVSIVSGGGSDIWLMVPKCWFSPGACRQVRLLHHLRLSLFGVHTSGSIVAKGAVTIVCRMQTVLSLNRLVVLLFLFPLFYRGSTPLPLIYLCLPSTSPSTSSTSLRFHFAQLGAWNRNFSRNVCPL